MVADAVEAEGPTVPPAKTARTGDAVPFFDLVVCIKSPKLFPFPRVAN